MFDDRCAHGVLQIRLPVPDPKNISQDFKFLYDSSRKPTPDGEYFVCTCTGRISYEYDIPALFVDRAVINDVRMLKKVPTN